MSEVGSVVSGLHMPPGLTVSGDCTSPDAKKAPYTVPAKSFAGQAGDKTNRQEGSPPPQKRD